MEDRLTFGADGKLWISPYKSGVLHIVKLKKQSSFIATVKVVDIYVQ